MGAQQQSRAVRGVPDGVPRGGHGGGPPNKLGPFSSLLAINATPTDSSTSVPLIFASTTSTSSSTSMALSTTSSPTPVNTSKPSKSTDHAPVIVGGVIGGIASLLLAGSIVYFLIRRRNGKAARKNEIAEVTEESGPSCSSVDAPLCCRCCEARSAEIDRFLSSSYSGTTLGSEYNRSTLAQLGSDRATPLTGATKDARISASTPMRRHTCNTISSSISPSLERSALRPMPLQIENRPAIASPRPQRPLVDRNSLEVAASYQTIMPGSPVSGEGLECELSGMATRVAYSLSEKEARGASPVSVLDIQGDNFRTLQIDAGVVNDGTAAVNRNCSQRTVSSMNSYYPGIVSDEVLDRLGVGVRRFGTAKRS